MTERETEGDGLAEGTAGRKPKLINGIPADAYENEGPLVPDWNSHYSQIAPSPLNTHRVGSG